MSESSSSNESFVVVSSQAVDEEGNSVTHMYKPMITFKDVPTAYPSSLDILVEISFDETYRHSENDKVFVLPVGWISFNDAVCSGEQHGNLIKFSKNDLPELDQNCQLCYCNEADKSVLGLSSSFKVQQMSEDETADFIARNNYASLMNKYHVNTFAEIISPWTCDNISKMKIFKIFLDQVTILNLCQSRLQESPINSISCKSSDTTVSNNAETIQTPVSNSGEDDKSVVEEVTVEMMKRMENEWKLKEEKLMEKINLLEKAIEESKKKLSSDSDSDSSDSNYKTGKRDTDSRSDSSFKTESTRKPHKVPVIYGITPTYVRPEQKALLVRLSHTLKLVPSFHWIVVEDSSQRSRVVTDILAKSGICFTHLTAPSPEKERGILPDSEYVVQRNMALQWLRGYNNSTGVVYFIDDFKIYSLEIFEDMRSIKRVGVWPVGLAGGLLAERPIVEPGTSRVVGWNSRWRQDRKFPIDAIGCAINLQHLIAHPHALFRLEVEPALRLSDFLSKLTTVAELEPKAQNCSQVYVWHLRVVSPCIA